MELLEILGVNIEITGKLGLGLTWQKVDLVNADVAEVDLTMLTWWMAWQLTGADVAVDWMLTWQLTGC